MVNLKNFLERSYTKAVKLNNEIIYSMLNLNPRETLIDLGCNSGELTMLYGKAAKCNQIYGVDVNEDAIALASSKGVLTHVFDLNEYFNLPDESFQIVCANQVIEHLWNSDNFLSEIYRILAPGGYAIISTENASSWCNIFASIMGWQIFSLTNFSSLQAGIGNPLALHKNSEMVADSWNHVRIYNYYGLIQYIELSGFSINQIEGCGYFPFPTLWGSFDKIHAHFLTIKISKLSR